MKKSLGKGMDPPQPSPVTPDGFLFSSGLKISWDSPSHRTLQLVVCMLHTPYLSVQTGNSRKNKKRLSWNRSEVEQDCACWGGKGASLPTRGSQSWGEQQGRSDGVRLPPLPSRSARTDHGGWLALNLRPSAARRPWLRLPFLKPVVNE